MKPHYDDGTVTVFAGDCIEVMRSLPDASVDAVVTDPPYGLDFMGKHWDTGAVAFNVETWTEALRVLKPGGHLAAFGGTRTWHRLACAIEDAGFEIRDALAWMYGSGFPKSLDVSKAIDKAAGATRGTAYIPQRNNAIFNAGIGKAAGIDRAPGVVLADPPVTDAARQWQGWGTALKPAYEPIVLARKSLSGTVAATVLEHGTGALNIDGSRVSGQAQPFGNGSARSGGIMGSSAERGAWESSQAGRWPANVVLDADAAAMLDRQSGVSVSFAAPRGVPGIRQNGIGETVYKGGPIAEQGEVRGHNDTGGASRFFYTAKADQNERPRVNGVAHPTVKPLDLMRWLVRLLTPPGGLLLEPFAGSGTTAEACIIEGFRCVAIEREPDYLPLIVARLSKPIQPTLGGDA